MNYTHHINGDIGDNRPENLTTVDKEGNMTKGVPTQRQKSKKVNNYTEYQDRYWYL